MPDPDESERIPLFNWTYDDGSGHHLLPADQGSFSLEGIAHAAMIATHYVAEGRVRHRAPFSEKFDIYISPPTEGSWTTDFVIELLKPATWAGATAGLVMAGAVPISMYAYKLLRRISARATGASVPTDETEKFETVHHGTFDALVDAATPSLVRAHRTIRSNKTIIRIQKGSLKFEFDRETKLFIETNIMDETVSEEIGNTAGYSVNQRTGRVYLDELQRTVPFLLHRSAPDSASIALARSLEAYASTRAANSDLSIRYLGTRAQDGRLKRILIFDARFSFGL